MKRGLVLLSAALAFSSVVAVSESAVSKPKPKRETVAYVRIAGNAAAAEAAQKLGKIVGDESIGMMAAMMLPMFPIYAHFGETEKNKPITLFLSVDPENPTNDSIGDGDSLVALAPIKGGTAAFKRLHPNAKEKEGVWRFKDANSGIVRYTAFTEDGKWASLAPSAKLAKSALKGVAKADVKFDGLLSLSVGKRALGIIRSQLLKQLENNPSDKEAARFVEALKSVDGAEFSLRLDDKGLGLDYRVKSIEGSALDAFGRVPLAADALAFAGKGSVLAFALADKSHSAKRPAGEEFKTFLSALKKKGVELQFLKVAVDGHNSIFTVNAPAAFQAFSGNLLEKIMEVDFADLIPADESFKLEPVGSAFGCSVEIEGASASIAPAARFAAVMPEAVSKKAYSAMIFSPYFFMRNTVISGMPIPDTVRNQLKPMIDALPPVDKGGLASISWREGSAFCGRVRISADEMKGIYAAGRVVQMMLVSMYSNSATDATDDDDDDDE